MNPRQLLSFSCLCVLLTATSFAKQQSNNQSVFDMSFEELRDLHIPPAATLTHADKRFTPAAVTTISQQQIATSGARDLDELLEMYVPGFQVMQKSNSPTIGIRGILSDRNGKMLLLVNGRVMNTRGKLGVVSERMLSIMGDIERIEVVRGPGSAIYGPGAIAGVINIITYSGSTFEGTDVQVRQGVVEEFTGMEVRSGTQLDNGAGLFFYYGLDQYVGADSDDAPLYFSTDFTTADGQQVVANRPAPFAIPNDREAYRQKLRQKLHLSYEQGGFNAWLRYTRGGVSGPETQALYQNDPPSVFSDAGQGYQQLTLMSSYEQRVNDQLSINYRLSYDLNDIEVNRLDLAPDPIFSAREDEYHARVLIQWEPDVHHKIALGTEYSHEIFGLKSPGYPGEPARYNEQLFAPGETMKSWNANTWSLLGEYQWQITPEWHLFLGGRGDRHSYTDWLISPRAAIIHAPTDRDTLKLLLNRSVRRADDSDIRTRVLRTGEEGDPEKIDSIEFRYERQQNKNLWLACSTYFSDYDIIGWTYDTGSSTTLGNLELFGLEAEMIYQREHLRLALSHNYTKQLDFTLDDPSQLRQNVSAAPYGYGNDLANWSSHSTQLNARYEFNKKWAASASLRALWGFPGGQDLAEYNADVLGSDPNLPVTDGSTKAWDESIFLNLGLQYSLSEHAVFRAHAHNVLGLFDEDLNKRNSFQRTSQWRNEAPALSFSIRYTF